MQKLLAILFLLCVGTVEAKEAFYTIQLGTYKRSELIHEDLHPGFEALGYHWKNKELQSSGEDNPVFKDTDTLHHRGETYVYSYHRFCYGRFTTADEAMAAFSNDSILSYYFADAVIQKVKSGKNGRRTYEQVKAKSMDDVMAPLVDGLKTALFWDPFALLHLHNPVIFDEDGLPSIDKQGNVRIRSIPFVVIWLVIGALFFTIRLGFINVTGFGHAIKLVTGKYDNPSKNGQVSHFQALATALSGTVGLGNIAGVAVAITLGGPGAMFWMVLAGLLGMSSKFVECTLGVKYRTIDKKGEVSGGPMYYLNRGLANKNLSVFGRILAVFFALCCIGGSFGGGNMFQANQAFAQVKNQFPEMAAYANLFGIILAMMVGVVIIGGIRSIAKITEKVVPFMAITYVLIALVILGFHYDKIGWAFGQIFSGAFDPGALKGGILGVLIVGFQRSAFSNEAGVGSASIAHSAVKTDHPVTEGIVALLEPFIDTVIICTMTALVIIITGFADNPFGYDGTPLTSTAFGSVFSWFPTLLMIAVFLFAFSTMLSWSYYGLKAWTFLFGGSRIADVSYKLLFLVFIWLGSTTRLDAVINFSDMMILCMAFPNILGMYFMSKEVNIDMKEYFANFRKKRNE